MRKYLTFVIALFFVSSLFSSEKPFILSGKITKDLSPFYISENSLVPKDSILIIESGVTIFFQGNIGLEVKGTIKAIGTQNDSIFIGTLKKSGWNGITIFDNQVENKSVFQYCNFFNANTHNPKYKTEKSALTINNSKSVEIKNCSFYSNRANYGGAISIFASNVIIENCRFEHNYAAYLGGAIVLSAKSFVKIYNSVFEKNNSDYYGGAIFVDKNSYLTLSGCLIDKNGASNGGAINIKNATVTIINNTISANNANFGGAICTADKSELTVINSIVWGNVAGENDNFMLSKETTMQIKNSIIEKSDVSDYLDKIEMDNVIFGNPKFNLTGKNPFSLADNSPAIDAGNNKFVKNILKDYDLAQNKRISGASIDIGAFEKNKKTLLEKSDYKLFFLRYDLNNEQFVGKIKFKWNSTKPALIKIIDDDATKINEIKIEHPQKGENTYIWNGKSLDGRLMSPGVYFFKVFQFNR